MRNIIIFTEEDLYDLIHDDPVVMNNKDGTEIVFVSEDGYKFMYESEANLS